MRDCHIGGQSNQEDIHNDPRTRLEPTQLVAKTGHRKGWEAARCVCLRPRTRITLSRGQRLAYGANTAAVGSGTPCGCLYSTGSGLASASASGGTAAAKLAFSYSIERTLRCFPRRMFPDCQSARGVSSAVPPTTASPSSSFVTKRQSELRKGCDCRRRWPQCVRGCRWHRDGRT